ncbi:MAG TPA: hypothetical protein VFF06_32775 [Polyangia bacterium]|nr:hypothetical protein [Polyangia bacterium]
MLSEFSAEQVTLDVLAHLERRRLSVVHDEALVRAEVSEALVPIKKAYREAELPMAYYDALEQEIVETVPVEWRARALQFTDGEKREFGLWRGGDPIARITYVFVGLVIGGLCVELPFIPIWEKWFPFVLAIAAWWLPTAQLAWHRRRYARSLGAIALKVSSAQPRLDAAFSTNDLLLPPKGES